jgi:hypothetical protein
LISIKDFPWPNEIPPIVYNFKFICRLGHIISLHVAFRMSVSTRSILRVYRNRINHPHTVFIGSAIYLGEGYAITCFHVIEPEAYETTEPTLDQALRDYRYRLLTENGSKFADVECVHGDRGPHKGDYALLKLKLTSDPSAHCVPIKLLGEVPATFLDPSASCDKLHWDDCDRIENCGYPGATGGQEPDIESLRLKETIRKPGDASGLLADWQLLGGVRHGMSGGAILAHAGEQQVCLGMSYLGGERGGTSRITLSNRIIEFLEQDLDELGCPADEYQKFVLTADDFLKSIDRQLRSECVKQLREAWERDFCESPQGVDDSRTPFIESQGLSILPVMSDPWPQLDPKYFRLSARLSFRLPSQRPSLGSLRLCGVSRGQGSVTKTSNFYPFPPSTPNPLLAEGERAKNFIARFKEGDRSSVVAGLVENAEVTCGSP